MVLAEVNRMEALVSFDLDYRKAMIYRLMAEADEQEDDNDKVHLIEEAVEVGMAILARSAARFALKGLVQNCFQVYLQVAMQAISKSSMPDHFDFFNGLTLGITIFSVFLDIPDMINIFLLIGWLQAHVSEYVSGEGAVFERVRKRIQTMKCRFLWIKIYAILYVFVAGYSLLKLYMALVVCPGGEWNLLDILTNYGCVEFDGSNIKHGEWQCNVTEYQCHYVE